MNVKCTKPQAATRQLDVAITLLFADYDPLAIRTVAAAAHGILSDLVERKRPGHSWRSRLIQASGLSKKDAVAVINAAQNYLKHADRDAESEFAFEEEENDHVIFFATLECGELGYPLSIDMQAFQIWYLAKYPETLGEEADPIRKARLAFPNVGYLTREESLRRGGEFVEQQKAKKRESGNAV